MRSRRPIVAVECRSTGSYGVSVATYVVHTTRKRDEARKQRTFEKCLPNPDCAIAARVLERHNDAGPLGAGSDT